MSLYHQDKLLWHLLKTRFTGYISSRKTLSIYLLQTTLRIDLLSPAQKLRPHRCKKVSWRSRHWLSETMCLLCNGKEPTHQNHLRAHRFFCASNSVCIEILNWITCTYGSIYKQQIDGWHQWNGQGERWNCSFANRSSCSFRLR